MVELLKSSHFEWAKNWKQVTTVEEGRNSSFVAKKL